jgi:predicted Zn-dependent peptidase
MPVIVKKYPNDFQIVYEKSLSALPLTTLYIFCDVGSVYEYDKIRGASHFIEHMCFKGTKKINSTKIFHEYSKIGAYFNAYTSKRYTCYTVKCQDQYVHHSLEILADMLMNSTFNETEFHREEKVVIEENNNNDNKPDYILEDAIDRMLYEGSSYESPVDSLNYHTSRTLNYKDVVDFYHTFYHPSRMFLSIVSNISFKDVEQLSKKTLFMRKITQKIPPIMPVIHHGITPFREPQYLLIEKRGVTNVHLSIGFRTCGIGSSDRHTLNLLSRIMGNGLNGRLLKLLRERKGLVYGATTTTEYVEHMGDFTFTTVTKKENLIKKSGQGVLHLLMHLIKEMIEKGVTKEEVDTAKGNSQGHTILDLQDIVTQTRYNGEAVLIQGLGYSKKIVPFQDIYETFIKNISMKDINSAIKRYFVRENMCVCILSEKLPSLEIIKRYCA